MLRLFVELRLLTQCLGFSSFSAVSATCVRLGSTRQRKSVAWAIRRRLFRAIAHPRSA
jgi:hypothetical protein